MKIAVIGAGPAGIYLSLFLKKCSGKVFLYEKNSKVGKKLKITGGGRMNLGNNKFSVNCFTSQEKNTLRNIFKNPHSKRIFSLFNEIDTKYKSEDNRLVLKSEDAIEEVKRLENLLVKQKNLELVTNTEVKEVTTKNDFFIINGKKFDFVVITTGSQVRIGEKITKNKAYTLPSSLGHNITETEPALCPLITKKDLFKGLEGISLECSLRNPKRKQKTTGNILFTHQGISGPAVLDFTVNELEEEIELNFLPNDTEEKMRNRILENRKGKVSLKKILAEYLPKRIIIWQLKIANIDEDKIIANLGKTEQNSLLNNLYRFKIQNPKKAPVQASWTMRGGVDLQEINPSTLESKIHKNLFFAGEILDITGLCGGFNISFAMLSAKIVSDAIFLSMNKNHPNHPPVVSL